MNKFELLFSFDLAIQNLYGKIITFFRKLRYSSKVLKNNVELKSKRSSDTCYVIGLGPSLKDVEYFKLKGDSIVVNRFHEFDKGKFTPTYYMLSDEAFFNSELIGEVERMYNTYPNTLFFVDGLYKNIILKNVGNFSMCDII